MPPVSPLCQDSCRVSGLNQGIAGALTGFIIEVHEIDSHYSEATVNTSLQVRYRHPCGWRFWIRVSILTAWDRA